MYFAMGLSIDMISHSDIKNGAQANETNQFSYQMSNDGEMHGK